MANGTIHHPQTFLRRAPWYSALGGLIGAMIGVVIMLWLCHCSCVITK